MMSAFIGASRIHRRPIRPFSVRTKTYPLTTTLHINYSFRARIPCYVDNLIPSGFPRTPVSIGIVPQIRPLQLTEDWRM